MKIKKHEDQSGKRVNKIWIGGRGSGKRLEKYYEKQEKIKLVKRWNDESRLDYNQEWLKSGS